MEMIDIPASEFCDSVRDGTHDSPKPVEGPGRPLVTTKHMRGGRINLEDAYLISGSDFEKVNQRSQVHQWDVLISMIGTLGELVLVKDEPTYAIKNIGLFKTKSKYDGLWLYYYLQSPKAKNHMHTSAQGSTQQYLSLKTLRGFPLSVPASETDKRAICEVLKTLDDKIELNQKMNQTLEEIAKAIFKSWFVDFDPVRAKAEGRPTGLPPEISDLFPDELVDSEIGEIPKGWSASTFSELADIKNGYAFKSKDWSEQGTIPVVKIGNVKPMLVDVESCSRVKEEAVSGLERFCVLPGDTLIGMTGYVGQVGLVPKVAEMPYLNQRVGRLVAHRPPDYGFMVILTRREDFKSDVEKLGTGSAQANVSARDIRSVKVVLPCTALKEKFGEIVNPIIDRILTSAAENEVLAELRDTLLPKLISGELRIPDAEKFLEEAGI